MSLTRSSLAKLRAASSAPSGRRVEQTKSSLTRQYLGRVKSGNPYAGRHAHTHRRGNEDRFYEAYRGVIYSALRPILSSLGECFPRIAIIPRSSARKEVSFRHLLNKSAHASGWIASNPDSASFDKDQRQARWSMSKGLSDRIPRTALILDDHPFLDCFRHPNDDQTTGELIACSFASMLTCGRALTLFDPPQITSAPSRLDQVALPQASDSPGHLYYCPITWAEPRRDERGIHWIVRNPYSSLSADPVTFYRGEYVYMKEVDPADPFGAISPLRAEAKSYDIDQKIYDVNSQGLTNHTNPSLVVSIGSTTGERKGRPLLAGNQRQVLTEAISEYVTQASQNGQPLVLDALINGIERVSRDMEVDYLKGSEYAERRLYRAYGVSEIITGQSTAANRAGSYEANKIFYNQVINPALKYLGEVLTAAIAPHYSNDLFRVVIYFDEKRAEDSELVHRRVQNGADFMTAEEHRHYIRTGEIMFTRGDDDWDGQIPFEINGGRLSSLNSTSGSTDYNENGSPPAPGTESASRLTSS